MAEATFLKNFTTKKRPIPFFVILQPIYKYFLYE